MIISATDCRLITMPRFINSQNVAKPEASFKGAGGPSPPLPRKKKKRKKERKKKKEKKKRKKRKRKKGIMNDVKLLHIKCFFPIFR